MFLGVPAEVWAIIPAILAYLIFIEGLLSADNALVLAVMVRNLPVHQQKRALRYGIWGAFVFRAIAVFFAAWLIRYWFLKALGGAYLLYLAGKHFLIREAEHDPTASPKVGRGFWGTVVNVELADIAFSVDSILTAVAVVEGSEFEPYPRLKLAIIYVGGVLGIVLMRMVAGAFLKLLDRFRGLAGGAYVLVGWIGIHLLTGSIHDAFREAAAYDPAKANDVILGGWFRSAPDWLRHLPWEIPWYVFWGGMGLIVLASLAYRPTSGGPSSGPRLESPEEGGLADPVDLPAGR